MPRYVIGIDEVGRGPLAGPVTVAAVALPEKMKIRNAELGKLRDSKKLSAGQREKWLEYIKSSPRILFATASVYPKVIDRVNISRAANIASTRALKKIVKTHKLNLKNTTVILDGGLRILGDVPHKAIIKGDEKHDPIKLASIVAKVRRDGFLKRYQKKYPEYGFGEHKGYGTKIHIAALKKRGILKIHRLTFVKNFVKI